MGVASMKKYMLLLSVLLLLAFAACSSTTEEVDTSSESSEPRNEEAEEGTEDAEDTEDVEEAEEVEENEDEVLKEDGGTLIDEERYSVDLVKVEKRQLEEDEIIQVTFDVKNKSEDYLDFFVDTASADGKMIPDENIDMWIEVSPGKEATDSFNIYKLEEDVDFEMPELKEELQIDIMVSDEEWEFEDRQTITIDF